MTGPGPCFQLTLLFLKGISAAQGGNPWQPSAKPQFTPPGLIGEVGRGRDGGWGQRGGETSQILAKRPPVLVPLQHGACSPLRVPHHWIIYGQAAHRGRFVCSLPLNIALRWGMQASARPTVCPRLRLAREGSVLCGVGLADRRGHRGFHMLKRSALVLGPCCRCPWDGCRRL